MVAEVDARRARCQPVYGLFQLGRIRAFTEECEHTPVVIGVRMEVEKGLAGGLQQLVEGGLITPLADIRNAFEADPGRAIRQLSVASFGGLAQATLTEDAPPLTL